MGGAVDALYNSVVPSKFERRALLSICSFNNTAEGPTITRDATKNDVISAWVSQSRRPAPWCMGTIMPVVKVRRGFTLLEMLIVIGILALLIALLFPVLSRARRSALRVSCLSNLRQTGTALIAYAQDHGGCWPAPANAWYPLDEDWVHWQPNRDVRGSSLLPYLGNNIKVLKCPTGVPERGETLGLAGRRFPPYPFSYSVNQSITGMGTTTFEMPGGCRLHQVVSPSKKILALEEDTTDINDGSWLVGDWVSGMPTSVSVRHDRGDEIGMASIPRPPDPRFGDLYGQYVAAGRGNVIFVDGHADFVHRRFVNLALDPRGDWIPPWE